MKVVKRNPLSTTIMAGLLRIFLPVIPVVAKSNQTCSQVSELRPLSGESLSACLDIKASPFGSPENFNHYTPSNRSNAHHQYKAPSI